jgi:hypothetical protein
MVYKMSKRQDHLINFEHKQDPNVQHLYKRSKPAMLTFPVYPIRSTVRLVLFHAFLDIFFPIELTQQRHRSCIYITFIPHLRFSCGTEWVQRVVGSRATSQTSETKIRQQELLAWWNCHQEPDDNNDEVMEYGEENQDELGDDWRKFFYEPTPDDAPSAGSSLHRA